MADDQNQNPPRKPPGDQTGTPGTPPGSPPAPDSPQVEEAQSPENFQVSEVSEIGESAELEPARPSLKDRAFKVGAGLKSRFSRKKPSVEESISPADDAAAPSPHSIQDSQTNPGISSAPPAFTPGTSDEDTPTGRIVPITFAERMERAKDFMVERVFVPIGSRAHEWKVRDKLEKVLPRDMLQGMPRTWEPAAVAEWVSSSFQREGSASFYGKLFTVLLCAFFLADLLAIGLEGFIPEPPTVRGGARYQRGAAIRKVRSLEDYNVIFARNLFNSQGIIPGEEVSPADNGGAPVKTSLPFNLIGTLILQDENRSIATIEDKSASQVFPVRAQDEIPNKAKILKVEAYKVIFINTATGRREFVDMPEDQVQAPKVARSSGGGAKSPGVERVAPNQFNVSRSEVDKTLADLNNVLTQARCVPNFENGLPNGFKCFQIVAGSIYDKLGMKNGDVLLGLNGEAINDPGKAFELLGQLKTSNHVELSIKRDGVTQNYAYDIR